MTVRAIDSTAAAYQATVGATPPSQVAPAKGDMLSSTMLLVIALVLLVVLGLTFLFKKRPAAAPAATATAPAAAAPAPAVAPAPAPPAPRPSRIGTWLSGWFTPAAAVVETLTRGEIEDFVDLMLTITSSANLDRTSVKKSLPKFVAKLQDLQNNGNFELRRYETTAPDSTDLEALFARFIVKNSSMEATNQEVSQQREAANRKLTSRDDEIIELKDKVTAAKQEATASGEEAKQARTDLIAYRNSITEIAKSERDMIRAGKRADSSAVLEGFLMAIDRQPQSRSAQTPRNDSRPNESGGNRGDRNRNRDRGSRPAPRPEGETAGA